MRPGFCSARGPVILITLMILPALCGLSQQALAGAWTQPKSRLWLKVGFLYQFTDTIYAAESAVLPDGTPVEAGDERPYDDGGAFRQQTLWLEGEYGVANRLTVGVQLPYQDLRFEDRFQITESWGFGDIRFIGRAALLDGSQRLTLRAAWKLAVGDAATDPDQVPVSEGQTDLELGLQWGTSLGRSLSWVGAEGGYRWRLEDDEGRIPGDELYWRLELGYAPVKAWKLAVKLGCDGLRAQTTFRNDLAEPGQRSYDRLELGLLWQWGAWILEPLLVTTLAGERYPAGQTWTIALHRFFEL